ncbi:MAG TPA: indolepyruvate ferredoxin oxidoreductase subunit alpha, partial [Thermoplasmatales archaeon]|nr:indolepyruvate ferredoxin oxidoreductase subunit alpha [Thermoplasmatales archaeon]
NEAITRGALEAGVDVATTYPGTPSSEIADTFSAIARYLKKKGEKPPFYFEYSTNEKVAVEVAAAASFCGLRSLTCMKHVGLNVASDAFMTYVYVGCRGGHIIVSADDPACHSSQNEQDNRYYALFSGAPMLEPATPEEAKEMTRKGFEVSEKLKLPLLLRTTTRLNHARGPVTLKPLGKPRGKGWFNKDPGLVTVPATARVKHKELLGKLEKAEKLSEEIEFTKTVSIGDGGDTGVITSGVSFGYVKEAAEDLHLDLRILKLGMTHPLPKKKCSEFMESCDKIIVVEELEPYLENQIKALAYELGLTIKIYGKTNGYFPRLYEYTPDIVISTLAKIFGIKNPLPKPVKPPITIPTRPPTLCPGCPHRATYYAAKKAAPNNTVYPTDIGCYTLGKEPPYEMADLLLCMGSNAGTACGLAVATTQKILSFMGDSTFFHAGIPAVIDAAHHNYDVVITVLDNRTTAMTGHQPHPGTDFDGMGNPAKRILVEEVAKGCGVEHIEVVNPKNLRGTIEAFKRALDYKGPSVIVSKSPCILLENRLKKQQGKTIPVFMVDQKLCTRCEVCITEFGCPAFYYAEDNSIHIDEQLCTGCGVCIQVCPEKAIKIKKQEEEGE